MLFVYICLAIVYQTLYKNVFNVVDIDNTVHNMLHERSQDYRHDKLFLKGNMEIREYVTVLLSYKYFINTIKIKMNKI